MEQNNTNAYTDIITQNKKQFQKYNLFRLRKFNDSLSSTTISDLLDALPLLMTINQSGIPGYVENYTPIGIYGYAPSNKTINFIKRRFPTVQLSLDHGDMKPLIERFAIMGSAASSADNGESDIVFWVCREQRNIDA